MYLHVPDAIEYILSMCRRVFLPFKVVPVYIYCHVLMYMHVLGTIFMVIIVAIHCSGSVIYQVGSM